MALKFCQMLVLHLLKWLHVFFFLFNLLKWLIALTGFVLFCFVFNFFFLMWDLPGPGLEPVSPALAGGFLTTAPPGKPALTGFCMLGQSFFFSPKLQRLFKKCLFIYF